MLESIKARYIENHYIIQTLIFVLVAFIGFYPSTVDVISGARTNPKLSIHLHAFLMVLWLALLMLQVSLKRRNQIKLHRRLGMTALIVAPLMLLSFAQVSWSGLIGSIDTPAFNIVAKIFFMQCYSIALFALFFYQAFKTRKSELDKHKRYMILATLILLHAAIGRMPWLPFYDAPASPNAIHAYNFLLIIPSLIYDKLTLNRTHAANITGLSLFLVCIVATYVIWDASWWQSFVIELTKN